MASFSFGGVHDQRARHIITLFDSELQPDHPAIATLEIIAKDRNGNIIPTPVLTGKQLGIQITGSVNEAKFGQGKVTINGYCNTLNLNSGEIKIVGAAQSASVMQGSIDAHYITNSATVLLGTITGKGGVPPKEAEVAVNAAKAIHGFVEEVIKKREQKKTQETRPKTPPLPKSQVTIEEVVCDKKDINTAKKKRKRPDKKYVAELD